MKMLEQRPSIEEVIVKLNEGVSGAGNALVDLRGIACTRLGSSPEVARRVRSMQLESATTPDGRIQAKFEQNGGVVEERIVGGATQPSVQLRATRQKRGAAVNS